MTVNNDPESIVNEPGRGFLGHLASCIQRYPYRGRQQFLVDFEAERHRQQTNTSGHVSEWFLLTGVDNHIFRSEFYRSRRPEYPVDVLGLIRRSSPIVTCQNDKVTCS